MDLHGRLADQKAVGDGGHVGSMGAYHRCDCGGDECRLADQKAVGDDDHVGSMGACHRGDCGDDECWIIPA